MGLQKQWLITCSGAGIIGANLPKQTIQNTHSLHEMTGQPYAFRQAGLTTGILLLVALTVTVGSREYSSPPLETDNWDRLIGLFV